MINIFKKIRLKLISENKLTRYFLYGIGEIILVVIGILIAFQLNNWNDQRKSKNKSLTYIENIKDEFKVNISANKGHLNQLENQLNITNSYIELLIYNSGESIKDSSIINLIKNLSPISKTALISSAYEELIYSNGLQSINNDTIKNIVIHFGIMIKRHENNVTEIKKYSDGLMKYILKNANLIYTEDSINFNNIPEQNLKINRDAFINNTEFINLLISSKGSITHLIYEYKYETTCFKHYEEFIDKYLKRLTKS